MKKFTIEFTWAVIYTLASLLWTVLEEAMGFHDEYVGGQMTFVWLFGLVAIPVYFFAIRDKRNNFYNRKANWTQLFLSGAIISVFVALMSPLTQYISLNLISPDFIRNSINYFVSSGKMKAEKAELFFSFRSLVLQAVSNGISIGVIISALAALFLKTESAESSTLESKPKAKSKQKRK